MAFTSITAGDEIQAKIPTVMMELCKALNERELVLGIAVANDVNAIGAGARTVFRIADGTTTATPTAAPTTLGNLNAADVSRLRSALGIDELTTALRMGAAGLGGLGDLPQFEMPKFEMPKFEMPKFELPDISSMFPTKQTGAPGQTTTVETPQPTTASTKVQVGGKTFDLARVGGAGLGGGDIKAMQNKGWTMGQIRQAATQAPRVSAGAQKVLNAPKAAAKTQARTITAKANKAVSKKK
jgi:hypothetical protein